MRNNKCKGKAIKRLQEEFDRYTYDVVDSINKMGIFRREGILPTEIIKKQEWI